MIEILHWFQCYGVQAALWLTVIAFILGSLPASIEMRGVTHPKYVAPQAGGFIEHDISGPTLCPVAAPVQESVLAEAFFRKVEMGT